MYYERYMEKGKKTKLAIFDIDGTIFRSSLLIELINGFVADGVFPEDAYREMEDDYRAWLDRKGDYDNYLGKVIEIYDRNIAGCDEEDVKRVVERVLQSEKDKVYRFTRDLVKRAKEDGYFIMAISGSPEFIVSKFAQHMGFDAYYGSIFEIKEGRFTGEVISKDSWKNKKGIIERFVNESTDDVDLADSMAVGDSGADIPMLEAVGKPIAFNPDRVLAEHAQKAGWRIVVERKNVVYEIQKCTINGY